MTELNSSLTVLVSTVTQTCDIFTACDSVYLVIPLAEISYNSAVYNESYTQETNYCPSYKHTLYIECSLFLYLAGGTGCPTSV